MVGQDPDAAVLGGDDDGRLAPIGEVCRSATGRVQELRTLDPCHVLDSMSCVTS
jgi:hypothetical protein